MLPFCNDLRGTMLGEKKLLSRCLVDLGSVIFMQDEISRALEYFEQALSIKEELKDGEGILSCFSRIGKCYEALGNQVLANEYYERAALTCELAGIPARARYYRSQIKKNL